MSSALTGIWAKNPSFAKPEVLLANGITVKFSDLDDRGIYFGANNVFVGHLRLFNPETKRQVIVWLDVKHTSQKSGPGHLTSNEIKELRGNLEGLTKALPDSDHLLVVVSNRLYYYNSQDINDKMCIIARDGLTFGTSPWVSLVSQVDERTTLLKSHGVNFFVVELV